MRIQEQIIVMSMSVCVSVYASARSPELYTNLHQIFMHVTRGCGSVLLWQRCDMLRTSVYIDDVTFAHNGQN